MILYYCLFLSMLDLFKSEGHSLYDELTTIEGEFVNLCDFTRDGKMVLETIMQFQPVLNFFYLYLYGFAADGNLVLVWGKGFLVVQRRISSILCEHS